MRNLMVFLFLLSFCIPAHAETLAERLDKIPEKNLKVCKNLSHSLFYQAAAGAPLEVLQDEIDHYFSLFSYHLKMNEEDRAYLKRKMLSDAFFELGKVKVLNRPISDSYSSYMKSSCSGKVLLNWE